MHATNSSPDRGKETVLIVDDEIETANCYRDILENAGYATRIVTSGEEALLAVSGMEIDAIVMDLVLKGMDGLAAARKIKENSSDDEFLPIIINTGYCTEENKVAGLAYADSFLSKGSSSNEIVATLRSLIKIRRLTRELKLSKEKYHRFYDNIPHLCVSVKNDGIMISSNKLFCDFCGLPKEQIEGKNIYDLQRKEERRVFSRFLEAVETTEGIPHQNVFTFILPVSGKPRKLNVRATAVEDEHEGKVIALAMEDITERLDLEEEKKIARKQLYRSSRLASIGTLASGVAHEMNNPLTAILGFSSALLGRLGNSEEINKSELASYLQVIHNETIRCRDIVDHLHRFARDSGEPNITGCSLLGCIANALRFVNMKAVRSEITILNDIRDDVMVRADMNRLEQVFINLLTNCIDFCPPGTTVHIARSSENRVSRFVAFTVRDNGPGMTQEVLEKAFDPFFTTKEVGKGIGMGLALCYKTMDELNGRIGISSEPNRGTSVILELPFYDVKATGEGV
ncbi:MAG: response regulator [Chitinispirillaceae bacterium]|nr:response regulator [Chitinispirillaceae bacterium]